MFKESNHYPTPRKNARKKTDLEESFDRILFPCQLIEEAKEHCGDFFRDIWVRPSKDMIYSCAGGMMFQANYPIWTAFTAAWVGQDFTPSKMENWLSEIMLIEEQCEMAQTMFQYYFADVWFRPKTAGRYAITGDRIFFAHQPRWIAFWLDAQEAVLELRGTGIVSDGDRVRSDRPDNQR